MPAEHTYWKILRGKMELAEMICLPALCTSPLKGRVIVFFGQGGGEGQACVYILGAALHPSGIAGWKTAGRVNTHCRRGRAARALEVRGGCVSGLCENWELEQFLATEVYLWKHFTYFQTDFNNRSTIPMPLKFSFLPIKLSYSSVSDWVGVCLSVCVCVCVWVGQGK